MRFKNHLLIFDPIPFRGGSKIATENILSMLDTNNIQITILTNDINSWSQYANRRIQIYNFTFLMNKSNGLNFLFKHLMLLLNIIFIRLLKGPIHCALATSGPGVDCALYFAKYLLGFPLIQIIQGPVAYSKLIGRYLLKAEKVFYLAQTKATILKAIQKYSSAVTSLDKDIFIELNNGLSKNNWPTRSINNKPVLFWAASLLHWKGLDTLCQALTNKNLGHDPIMTNICYTRPENTALKISTSNIQIKDVRWFESPDNLDQIRAESSIFVSTSIKEPFGLSILESLAAGLCIIIPRDGAYWDQILSNRVNCLKYKANDYKDLLAVLNELQNDNQLMKYLAKNGARLALGYQAEQKYQHITNTINNLVFKNKIT